MKKIKILVLLFVCICLSGCNANYDIEFVDNKIKERTSIINNDIDSWDNYIDNGRDVSDGPTTEEEEKKYTYKEYVDSLIKEKSISVLNTNDKYYKMKKIFNDTELGIKYSYDFTVDDYNDSSISNECFKYFNFMNDDVSKKYILSTSKGFTCFSYEELDNVTVHLKTNHKVSNNNADSVDGYNYYWYIDSSNASDKSIYVELYKDKYVFNYEHRVEKIVIVVLSVAFFLFVVIIILRKRAKKSNSI